MPQQLKTQFNSIHNSGIEQQQQSSSHIHPQRHNMGIQHGGVKRRDEKVEIGEHDGHGAVDDAVGAVDETFGLVRIAGIIRGES